MAVIILKAWLIWGAGNRGSRWLIYLFSFRFHFSFNLGFRSPQTPVGNIRFPPVEIRGTAESSDNTLSDCCWTKDLQTLRDNEFGDCDFDVPISLLIDRKAGTSHCSLPRLLSFDSVFQMWFFFSFGILHKSRWVSSISRLFERGRTSDICGSEEPL